MVGVAGGRLVNFKFEVGWGRLLNLRALVVLGLFNFISKKAALVKERASDLFVVKAAKGAKAHIQHFTFLRPSFCKISKGNLS